MSMLLISACIKISIYDPLKEAAADTTASCDRWICLEVHKAGLCVVIHGCWKEKVQRVPVHDRRIHNCGLGGTRDPNVHGVIV